MEIGDPDIEIVDLEPAPVTSTAEPEELSSRNPSTSLKLNTTSYVWEYFEAEGQLRSKCNLCQAVVSRGTMKSKTTTNMRNHLKGKHNAEFKLMTEKEKPDKNTSETPSTTIQRQPTLPETLAKRKIWDINDHRAVKLHYAIGEMLATDNQPFLMVEDTGFRRVLNEAQPNYEVPGRTYFSDKVIPDIFTRVRQRIQNQIDLAQYISLTSDIWTTAHTNESFISFTSHWLDKDFNLKHAVLNVKHFPGSHTGEAISSSMQLMLTDWKIDKNRVHLMVTDNAANMINGVSDADIESASCFLHTLQLVIKDSIACQRSVTDMISRCRNIVTHFHHSSKACTRLREIQSEVNDRQHKLFQDVPTRWNSTFYMLQRILEQKRSICVYATESSISNLTANEWKLLQSTVDVLQPFEIVTKRISQLRSVISEVIPEVRTLKRFLEKESLNHPGVGTLKLTLLENLTSRFEIILNEKNFTHATYLDPRFKSCFFKDKSQTDEIELSLRTLLETLGLNPRMEDIQPPPSKKVRGETEVSFSACFDEIVTGERDSTNIVGETSITNTSAALISELKSYVAAPMVKRTHSPFVWWATNGNSFPNLKGLAIKFLSAPASSVYSERLFSETGLIYEDNRNRLLPKNGEILAFLNYNLKLLNFNY